MSTRRNSPTSISKRRAPVFRTAAKIGICILAGGLSSRMGRNKANVRLGRQTLLEKVRATAKKCGVPVRIIRRDRIARCGPLGGIYTGLVSSRNEAELFVACDMPFITERLLRQFTKPARAIRRAVFVRTKSRTGFPCLVPCEQAEVIREGIEAGILSIGALATTLGARYLKAKAGELTNINTLEELREAERWISRKAARKR